MESSKLMHHISVDCVVFGFDFSELQVLLVQREISNPINPQERIKEFKIPGNFISYSEDLDLAADRVLLELTGLSNVYLQQFQTFGSPKRLSNEVDRTWLSTIFDEVPRRIITLAYFALIPVTRTDAKKLYPGAKWLPVSKLPKLPFDHNLIINRALEKIRNKIYQDPIVFELLPKKFSLTQLQQCHEVIIGEKLDKRNFRKRVSRLSYLIPLDEKQKNVAHKPAQLYRFDKKKYEIASQDRYIR